MRTGRRVNVAISERGRVVCEADLSDLVHGLRN